MHTVIATCRSHDDDTSRPSYTCYAKRALHALLWSTSLSAVRHKNGGRLSFSARVCKFATSNSRLWLVSFPTRGAPLAAWKSLRCRVKSKKWSQPFTPNIEWGRSLLGKEWLLGRQLSGSFHSKQSEFHSIMSEYEVTRKKEWSFHSFAFREYLHLTGCKK